MDALGTPGLTAAIPLVVTIVDRSDFGRQALAQIADASDAVAIASWRATENELLLGILDVAAQQATWQPVKSEADLLERVLPKLYQQVVQEGRPGLSYVMGVARERQDDLARKLNATQERLMGPAAASLALESDTIQWERRGDEYRGTIILLTIPRTQIQACDTEPFLALLREWTATASALERNASQLVAMVDGYNQDPREIVDIPEVCTYFAKVHAAAPWWPHLAHPSTYIAWLGALVPGSRLEPQGDGIVTLHTNPAAVDRVLQESLFAVGALYGERGVPAEDCEVLMGNLSMALGEFLAGEQDPTRFFKRPAP